MCCPSTCSSAFVTRSLCTSVQVIPKISPLSRSVFIRKRCVSCAIRVSLHWLSHHSDSPLQRHARIAPVGDLHARFLIPRSFFSFCSHARIRRRPLAGSSSESRSRDRFGVSSPLVHSMLVHNLLFDCLFFPLRSTSVAAFLSAVSLQLCRHVAAALTLEPPHFFLVGPHLPVTLRHSLVKQHRFASLPLPKEWKQSDADVEWRRAWHVDFLIRWDRRNTSRYERIGPTSEIQTACSRRLLPKSHFAPFTFICNPLMAPALFRATTPIITIFSRERRTRAGAVRIGLCRRSSPSSHAATTWSVPFLRSQR